MSNIKVGAVVQLKSGGPKMTVKSIMSPSAVGCQWFEGAKLQNGVFDSASLKVVEEEQKSN
jgi:uncharacterized protein YodC (DUF2158 family)